MGRGALAGPVTAVAAVLSEPIDMPLRDSKQMTAQERSDAYHKFHNYEVCWGIGWVSNNEIDRVNIHHATLLAMHRGFLQLMAQLRKSHRPIPDIAHVDGKFAPPLTIPARCIVKGDQTDPHIQVAAIIAKHLRDRLMIHFAAYYPQYGFSQHKGYATQQHKTALSQFGCSNLHRQSFRLDYGSV